MKYQAFATKEGFYKILGQLKKKREEARQEAIRMFRNSNAEITGYYALPTKRGEWGEYVEVCKR